MRDIGVLNTPLTVNQNSQGWLTGWFEPTPDNRFWHIRSNLKILFNASKVDSSCQSATFESLNSLENDIIDIIQELRSPTQNYGESNETWSAVESCKSDIADRLEELFK